MIQAVIVEDEMLVRLGTKLCLEEYPGAIHVMAAFEDGENALKYFQSHTADVLITDIKLNGMSGLELIRKVKNDHMQMRTIVLSCYEDFSYAREAMELGVDKYLLKQELTDDDLPKIVTELCRESRFISASDTSGVESIQHTFDDQKVAGYFLGYLVLRGERDAVNSGREQLDMNILAEIIQRLLNAGKLGECFLRYEEEIFIVFQMGFDTSSELFSKKIEKFFDRLSRNIFNYFNKNAYLFLSDFFESMGEITHMFRKMKELSAYAFYCKDPVLIWADKMDVNRGQCPRLSVNTEGIFNEDWFHGSNQQVETFFQEAKYSRADVIQVKAEIVKYFYALKKSLEEYDLDGKKKESSQNYTNIDAFDSAIMLKEWLQDLLKEIKEKLPGGDEQLYRIEQYIKDHYHEGISLEQISMEFHMSMAYFCQYFKKHEGVNFVTYLNAFRIQKARELLKNPQMSTEQVAEAVGIPNPNYFVRLFKKITGQTVGTYRKGLKL